MENQSEQLKTSCAELQSVLASERGRSAELSSLLSAERQAAASADEQCTILSERLSDMQKTLFDTENRLHAVLYVSHSSLHTHTHTFNGPLSRTTRVSRFQKGKTNLDFTEAGDCEW